MESFIGAEKVFIVDAVLYREPMKLDEDGGDAVSWFGAGDDL